MKVSPVASPADIRTSQGPDLKARAIQAFNQANNQANNQTNQGQANQTVDTRGSNHPQQLNQNAISSEDLGAIIPKPDINPEPEIDNSTPVSEPQTEKPEDPALSRQFAQLARQEKQLRLKAQQQDQAIKAREAALAAREAELQAKDTQYKTGYIPVDQLKRQTLATLEEAGISYDDLTAQQMSRLNVDPTLQAHISKLEAKLAALEEHNTNSQKTYQEQQANQYQAAVKQIKIDTQNLVKSNPDYEAIRATGSVQDVVDLITKTFDKDGVLLSVEEAAQEVENYLVEESLKLTQIQKIKARMAQAGASNAAKPNGQQTQPTKQTQPMKTLTNATASSRQLSAKERAILAFRGELK